MESFYLITPVALITIAVAIKLLLWAIKSGQYDDLDREASRILFDDALSSQLKSTRSDGNDYSVNSSTDSVPVDGHGHMQ